MELRKMTESRVEIDPEKEVERGRVDHRGREENREQGGVGLRNGREREEGDGEVVCSFCRNSKRRQRVYKRRRKSMSNF